MTDVPFSPREKEFVQENKDKMFYRQIANELASRFPEDNNGNRSISGVKKLIQRTSL